MPHLLSIVSVDSIAHTAIITPVRNFENKTTQATVGGSPFGPLISVARGHSRE